MGPSLSFVTLDVFTTARYTGNPLAIINVPASHAPLSQSQKQRMAREFNLSESVFLHGQTESDIASSSVRIDIFTAYAEVPFAGHPTVGTANYLLRILQNDPLNQVQALQAKAGRFGITLDQAVNGTRIGVAHDVHIHADPFADRPFGQYPVVSIVKGMTFILAQLPDLEALGRQTKNLLGTENTYTSQDALDEGWRTGIVATYVSLLSSVLSFSFQSLDPSCSCDPARMILVSLSRRRCFFELNLHLLYRPYFRVSLCLVAIAPPRALSGLPERAEYQADFASQTTDSNKCMTVLRRPRHRHLDTDSTSAHPHVRLARGPGDRQRRERIGVLSLSADRTGGTVQIPPHAGRGNGPEESNRRRSFCQGHWYRTWY